MTRPYGPLVPLSPDTTIPILPVTLKRDTVSPLWALRCARPDCGPRREAGRGMTAVELLNSNGRACDERGCWVGSAATEEAARAWAARNRMTIMEGPNGR